MEPLEKCSEFGSRSNHEKHPFPLSRTTKELPEILPFVFDCLYLLICAFKKRLIRISKDNFEVLRCFGSRFCVRFSTRIQDLNTAERLKRPKPLNYPPIAFVIFDCTEGEKDTCSKYGVSGYPTFKIFKPGEVSQDYTVQKKPKVSSNT
uniref:Thioredoxin domain-containing protein n=1 Tax=Megaselia scalaris TaxID=36166 RepID=T1GT17_MEGSC